MNPANPARDRIVFLKVPNGTQEPVTALLTDSTEVPLVGRVTDLQAAYDFRLNTDQNGVVHWFGEDAITGLNQVGSNLHIVIRNGWQLVVEGGTIPMFNYAIAAANAQREGRPIPPAPAGMDVRPM